MIQFVKDAEQILAALGDLFTPERLLFLGWIYCAAVQSLVDPVKGGSKLYLFFFRFAHFLAGNTSLVRRPPQASALQRAIQNGGVE